MSFNIPFIAVNKLLNVEDYITGKITTKSNSVAQDDDDDDELPPILSPQPTPGLLLDHSKVEASRTRIENVWNTQKDFPSVNSKKLCCLYCGLKLVSNRRWFLPTRREKKFPEVLDDDPITISSEPYFIYFGEGVFCTYYCAFMQCETKKIRSESSALYNKLLKLMYLDFSGRHPPVIDVQITRDHLEKFGGFLSTEGFRENALKYEPK